MSNRKRSTTSAPSAQETRAKLSRYLVRIPELDEILDDIGSQNRRLSTHKPNEMSNQRVSSSAAPSGPPQVSTNNGGTNVNAGTSATTADIFPDENVLYLTQVGMHQGKPCILPLNQNGVWDHQHMFHISSMIETELKTTIADAVATQVAQAVALEVPRAYKDGYDQGKLEAEQCRALQDSIDAATKPPARTTTSTNGNGTSTSPLIVVDQTPPQAARTTSFQFVSPPVQAVQVQPGNLAPTVQSPLVQPQAAPSPIVQPPVAPSPSVQPSAPSSPFAQPTTTSQQPAVQPPSNVVEHWARPAGSADIPVNAQGVPDPIDTWDRTNAPTWWTRIDLPLPRDQKCLISELLVMMDEKLDLAADQTTMIMRERTPRNEASRTYTRQDLTGMVRLMTFKIHYPSTAGKYRKGYLSKAGKEKKMNFHMTVLNVWMHENEIEPRVRGKFYDLIHKELDEKIGSNKQCR